MTQQQIVKYKQHLETKRAREEEEQIQIVVNKKAIEKLHRPPHSPPENNTTRTNKTPIRESDDPSGPRSPTALVAHDITPR